MPPIVEVAVNSPLRKTLDYRVGADAAPVQVGQRVQVPLKRRQAIGIITGIKENSSLPLEQIKYVTQILDAAPLLSADLMELLFWLSDYYHHSLGEVLAMALPLSFKKGKATASTHENHFQLSDKGANLRAECFKNKKAQWRLYQLLIEKKMVAQKTLKSALVSAATLKFFIENGWIEKVEPENSIAETPLVLNPADIQLNGEQQAAVNQVLAATQFQCFLLQGITGSGKTEVYCEIIYHMLAQGKSALVLVPEIALTPQTVKRFSKRFGADIGVVHSHISQKEKNQTWLKARSGELKLIIGTRSAIFAPLKNLGVIIIDEEHDGSYKQKNSVRYSARDVAVRRAQLANIPIVLGSATPSLESLFNAKIKKYTLVHLTQRATGAKLPEMQLIDLKREKIQDGLTPTLIENIKIHLNSNAQVLLFLNRRGFSTVLLCYQCGNPLMCQRCDARLVYHRLENQLRCHHCDYRRHLSRVCPHCQVESLYELGAGTEKIEFALQKLFPDIELIRIDRDRVRNNRQLHADLEKIAQGKKQILLGTQMLTKGHHFPNVTLVGIIDGDSSLFSTDFRAAEHMAQTVIQVAGRAGRAENSGKVFIQTGQTGHPVWQNLLKQDYLQCAENLLAERFETKLPPYYAMAILRAESVKAGGALNFLEQCKTGLAKTRVKTGEFFGPHVTAMEKKQGRYRAQLIIQASSKSLLQRWLKQWIPLIETHRFKSARWYLDVDPMEWN